MKITFFLRDKDYELIIELTGNEYIPPIGTEVWFDNYDNNDNLIVTCLIYIRYT